MDTKTPIKTLLNRCGLVIHFNPFYIRSSAYKRKNTLRHFLPESLVTTSQAQSAPYSTPSGRLAEIWNQGHGSHKWHHYFPLYEEAFANLVGKSPTFLEIGVQNGGSLRMWRKYFGEESTIVGIDIDPECAQHDDPDSGIHVRIGSQVDARFLIELIREFGPFDAILDDGSHLASHIPKTFGYLFGDGLVNGGIYMVEDGHATYWASHRDVGYSFSEFVRDLTDYMHVPYFSVVPSKPFEHRWRDRSVPHLWTMLDSFSVGDSVLTIRKTKESRTLPMTSRNGQIEQLVNEPSD